MARTKLTDRLVDSIYRNGKTKDGKDLWDSLCPGLGIRNRGLSYVFAARFPGGSPSFTRRKLAPLAPNSLDRAREKARKWTDLISKGHDPAREEEREQRKALQKRATTFAAVAGDYLANEVRPRQRNAPQVEREFDRVLIPLWGSRPITDVSEDDIQAVVEGVKKYGTANMLTSYGIKPPQRKNKRGRPSVAQGRPAPGQARNLLGVIKMFFSWVRGQKKYGLTVNPAAELKSKALIGSKKPVDRFLNDTEIAAFWRNAERLRYPYNAVYKLLLLTGLRLNEVADAERSEIDRKAKTWTIPKERMKGRNEHARAHAVPLTDDMLAILDALPKFSTGDYLFSTTFGKKPVWINDKIKKRLDARMLRSLRALARMHGEDHGKVKLPPWTNHDTRRTVRSNLTKLKIDHDTKEAILSHAKVGLTATYDVYDLFHEKKEALEKWGARVRALTSPQPDNVVTLPARA